MPFRGLALRAIGSQSTSRADLRLFPLPASDVAVSGITEPGAPSSLFVAAHSGASPPTVATLRLGVIMDAPSRTQNDTRLQSRVPRSRQVASRRYGIAIIGSPLAEPGSGTEVPSRGGQSSSVRRVRRAARRPESRSLARSRPRRLLSDAFPSMRFLDPRF